MSHFGAKGGQPIELFLKAFLWHHERGTLARTWQDEGVQGELKSRPMTATAWPDRGFEEWFLMTAVYPWLAAEGVLTFLHWSVAKLGVSHLLDIEYVTWAHPGSEVLRCPKPVEALLPWDSDMSPPTIKVRPDTEVIVRERERIGPAHGILFEDMAEALKVFPAFTGSLEALLDPEAREGSGKFWSDVNPRLKMGAHGGEIFLDRRYEDYEVAVCGEFFVRVCPEIESLAATLGLAGERWQTGKLRKVPNLNGPLTLWRTEFSGRFFQEWRSVGSSLDPAIFLGLWVEAKRARVVVTSARQMGWKVH
ncbi:MAG: hypothetical protein QNL68_00835 [Akkermansiaceae bacterium]